MAIKQVRVKINGVYTNLTKNASTGKWTGTVTAPAVTSHNQAGGYYPITVEAVNDAGGCHGYDTGSCIASDCKRNNQAGH